MPEGTIYSLTWIHPRGEDASAAASPSSSTGAPQPYNIVLVDLDEGGRVMSRVRGSDPQIGQRVRAVDEDGVRVFEAVA